jgi:hypothetical protein
MALLPAPTAWPADDYGGVVLWTVRASRSAHHLGARSVAFTVAAAAAFALTTAACGGNEVVLPGPESPTAPLTKADYTRRANEICRATEREIAAKTEAHGPSVRGAGSGEQAAELLAQVEPVARQAIERLQNLTPPPEDAELLAGVTASIEAALDRAQADPQATISPINTVNPPLYDYGLTGCFTKA